MGHHKTRQLNFSMKYAQSVAGSANLDCHNWPHLPSQRSEKAQLDLKRNRRNTENKINKVDNMTRL